MSPIQHTTGFGIGLRVNHYDEILATKPKLDWFEILSEDFLVDGGSPLYYLNQIRHHYPVAMHGVSMSIGSCDTLDWEYLARLKKLIKQVEPMWVSDHLCWTGVNDINLHDLMPLPYTEEAINHVVKRIQQVQDFLGQQILLENVSTYIAYTESNIPEWEFLKAVAEQSDCLILLDLNNIHVNSYNHGFDPIAYMHAIPKKRVKQFHLAGHKNCDTHIIDTHDAPIVEKVWDLYANAVALFPQAATLIERDDNIPPLTELLEELHQAKHIHQQVVEAVHD